MKWFKYIIFLIFLGCSTGEIEVNDDAQGVKITDHLPPYTRCSDKGVIYGSRKDDGDRLERKMREVRRELRVEAARRGANYVVIETNNNTTYEGDTVVVLSGTSYFCRLGQASLQ